MASWVIVPDVPGQENKAAQDQAVANIEKRGQVFRDEIQAEKPVIGSISTKQIDDRACPIEGFERSTVAVARRNPDHRRRARNLKWLTSLTDLSLDNTEVGDAGWRARGLEKPSETVPRPHEGHRRWVFAVEGAESPRNPVTRRDRVTDPGMVHLKGLTRLEWLLLHDTQVGDAGLRHLKGLADLEFLFLHNTQVSDAGLEHLKGLSRLQILNVENTRVTDAGSKIPESAAKAKISH